eukprot:2204954-Rhodomonas_salina.2
MACQWLVLNWRTAVLRHAGTRVIRLVRPVRRCVGRCGLERLGATSSVGYLLGRDLRARTHSV